VEVNDIDRGLKAWLPKPGEDPRVALFFGLDRSRPVIREASKPSLSIRLYRAWRALLGDFG